MGRCRECTTRAAMQPQDIRNNRTAAGENRTDGVSSARNRKNKDGTEA